MKLAITLRHLATGDSYHSLMYFFRVPHNSISGHVKEVCEEIIAEFAGEGGDLAHGLRAGGPR